METIKGYEENIYTIDFEPLPPKIENLFKTNLRRSPTIGDILAYSGLSLILEAYLYLSKTEKLEKINDNEIIINAILTDKVLKKVPTIEAIRKQIFIYKTKVKRLK